jgi:hypothetical protein
MDAGMRDRTSTPRYGERVLPALRGQRAAAA